MVIEINRKLPIVDFDTVPYEGVGRGKVPNGWYNCAVNDIIIVKRKVKDKEEDCVIVVSSIVGGDYQGRTLKSYYYIFTRSNNRSKFKVFIRSLGFTDAELQEMGTDSALYNAIIGLNFRGYVETSDKFTNLNKITVAVEEYSNGSNILGTYKKQQEVLNHAIDSEDTAKGFY